MKVLLIDDEEFILSRIKSGLEKIDDFDLEVDTALTAEIALEKVKKNGYVAVVSDYMLEDKDGLELLSDLKQVREDLPFILLTGKGHEDVAMEALNRGAERYLTKEKAAESGFKRLAGAINDVVEKKEITEELKRKEQLYRTVFENTGTAMALIDDDFTISFANRKFHKLIGFYEENVKGRSLLDFMVEEDKRRMKNYNREQKEGSDETPRHIDMQLKTKHEEVTHVLGRMSPIPDTKKHLVSYIDMSERKEFKDIYKMMSAKEFEEQVEYLVSKVQKLKESDLSEKQLDILKEVESTVKKIMNICEEAKR